MAKELATGSLSIFHGIGTSTAPWKSSRILHWKDEEGHKGTFQPFVLNDLPVKLWAHDILLFMSTVLTTSPVDRMMNTMAWKPEDRLGRNSQGLTSCLNVEDQFMRISENLIDL